MKEKFTQLFALPSNLYAENVPVMISAGALQKNNESGKVFVQLRLQNISSDYRNIIAVKVAITPYDIAGNELGSPIIYQYLDLDIERGEEFGSNKAIYMDDVAVRSFCVTVLEVVFSERELWTATYNDWEALGTQTLLDDELGKVLAAQYRRDTFAEAKYVLSAQAGVWLCACGTLNYIGENNCCKCHHSKSALFLSLDHNTLADHLLMHEEALKNKAAIEKKQADEASSRLFKKVVVGFLAAVLLFFGGLALDNFLDKPKKEALTNELSDTIWSWYDYIDLRNEKIYYGHRIRFFSDGTCFSSYKERNGVWGPNYEEEYSIVNISGNKAKIRFAGSTCMISFTVENDGKYRITSFTDDSDNIYQKN